MNETHFKSARLKLFLFFILIFLFFGELSRAQSSAFTYQGKLTDTGGAASGIYDLQFKLYDVQTGGTLLGTLTRDDIQVTNGIFTIQLDFGSVVFTNNSGRFLEIGVRPGISTGAFMPVLPRQEITAAPYALRSLEAGKAALADDSQKLGGVSSTGFVKTFDPRLSDDRNPLPGSANYVQNQSGGTQSADFNISGTGSANAFNAATQYNIGGFRAFTSDGVNSNTFAGFLAGVLTTGNENSFYGVGAGRSNTTGSSNSFFGTGAGFSNTVGGFNSYFGKDAGRANQQGISNSFFGARVGINSTTGDNNSFFGAFAGQSNTSGDNNSFFGTNAGLQNTEAGSNSFFGFNAGRSNTLGSGNSFFGSHAGNSNIAGHHNSFFGDGAGASNQYGTGNSYFGFSAGGGHSGSGNTFIGVGAGDSVSSGNFNTAVGNSSLSQNFGSYNTTLGYQSGGGISVENATAIGANAFVERNNSLVLGSINGVNSATADTNVGIGTTSPRSKLHISNGKIYVEANGQGVILKSPVGSCFELTVTNAGSLTTTPIACP
ncbi:MAG: hypothetical protein M3209_10710 [Acidobacteriota bacterium]|nr:hypothetical protein [Acidobacteriota bacterium]